MNTLGMGIGSAQELLKKYLEEASLRGPQQSYGTSVSIPKGGGPEARAQRFNTGAYGGYVSSGDDEVASGGNYGGAAIQHPHGRRGAINDLRKRRARPGGGVYEAAIRGLFDGQSPGWGGNNSDVDRIRRMNEQIRNAELQRAIQAGRSYYGR